jgi:hypothetical protein
MTRNGVDQRFSHPSIALSNHFLSASRLRSGVLHGFNTAIRETFTKTQPYRALPKRRDNLRRLPLPVVTGKDRLLNLLAMH